MAETQIEGGPGDNFVALQVRLWTGIPSQKPQGTLVVALGSGMNGLHLADDPGWRRLAHAHGLALASVNAIESSGRHSWHMAEHGSGRAFLKALDAAYRQARMPEAATHPLYLVGLSTGGQFGYHLALLFPNRLGGFVTLKGGMHRLPDASDALTVPGLLVSGEKDLPFRVANLAAVATEGRKRNAPWIHLVDPGTGHESERITRLIPAWLQAVRTNTLNGPAFQQQIQAYLQSPETTGGLTLSLASHQPAPVAALSTTTLDLGSWPWDQGSPAATLHLHPTTEVSWDRIEATSVKSLYDVSWEASSTGQTLHVRAKPAPQSLTAPIRDEVRIIYFQGSRKLLACDRVTLHSRANGPLRAIPSTLLAPALSNLQPLLRLKITPTDSTTTWKIDQIHGKDGLEVLHWDARPDGIGGFQIEAQVQTQPDAHGNLSGTLSIQATSPQTSTTRLEIPFIGKLLHSSP